MTAVQTLTRSDPPNSSYSTASCQGWSRRSALDSEQLIAEVGGQRDPLTARSA